MKDKAFFSFGGGVQLLSIALLLIHQPDKLIQKGMEMQNPIYVHSSALPLDRAVIDQLSLNLGIDYGFGKECEGHCGV